MRGWLSACVCVLQSSQVKSHRHQPTHPPPKKQDPSFKLRLKSGITMVSENGVKVRVERDTEYATMKV